MKINLSKDAMKDGLLSHIILECLSKTVFEMIAKKDTIEKVGVVSDIKLTIDGHNVNLEKFIDLWQNHVNRIIAEKAADLLKEKFVDVQNMLTDLEERVSIEIKKRPEDWEREE